MLLIIYFREYDNVLSKELFNAGAKDIIITAAEKSMALHNKI